MNRLCRIAVKCPGPIPGLESDYPVTNYSSEYTDGPDFPVWRFPVPPPYDPGNPKWWSTDACGGAFHCVSSISQDDADFCAAALAKQCTVTPPPPTNDDPICIVNPAACQPPVPELFPNQTQTASFTCPDSSIFYWTVPAGSVYATSTALANYTALAIAKEKVAKNFICLSNINGNRCLGDDLDTEITASGNDTYTFLFFGSVPPGCIINQTGPKTALISGIPTATGVSYFSVQATGNTTGSVVEKSYVISVIGILTESLPDGVVGTAYNASVIAEGGALPYNFVVSFGTLPAGLSMDSSGQITGTPTEAIKSDLIIEVTDSLGLTCFRNLSISVLCLISTASLPNAENGVFYSETLAVNGFTGSVIWSIIAGALPSGLSLNSSTGEISGTPDTDETQAFTIQAQQGEIPCQKDLSITVESGVCYDWSLNTWNAAPFSIGPNHTESYSAVGNSFNGAFTATQQGGSESQSQVTFTSAFTLNTTAPCCGRVSLIVTRIHGAPSINEILYVQIGTSLGGSDLLSINNASAVTGDFDFTLPNTGGVDDTIYVTIGIQASSPGGGGDEGQPYGITASGTFNAIPCP